jgi:hypothetical protein
MREWFFTILLSAVGVLPASAQQFADPQTSADLGSWRTLAIGPGGQLTNLDIQCDQGVRRCSPGVGTVTKVVRTDTYGAWLRDANVPGCGNASDVSGCWRQLVTPSSMPHPVDGNGVYEIVIAPSNTSHLYMYYGGDGCLYSSANKGLTWVADGLLKGPSCIAADPNTGAGGSKFLGPFMAVDPQNEDIVYTATPSSGAFVSTNGGRSWSPVIALGAGSSMGGQQGGGTIFAFDPTSAVAEGKKQGIYACTYGIGVYHSTDGGATWTLTSNTPTTCRHLVVDPTGVVWLTDDSHGSHNLNVYSGSWITLAPVTDQAKWQSIAVDTNNCSSSASCRVVVADDSGQFAITTIGATAGTRGFSERYYRKSRAAADVPWLAVTNENYMTNGNQMFDPTQSNTLEFAEGIGYWRCNPPASSSAAFVWNSLSAGIQQLPSLWGISPPGGNPILTFWDRPVFVSSDPNVYPASHGLSFKSSIISGWGIDYAPSNPKVIVALANFFGDSSGYSINGGGDGGPANWRPFGSLPDEISPGGNGNTTPAFVGGSIAASTATNFLIALSNNGDLYYTNDGGNSWAKSLIPGVPQSATAITNDVTEAGSTTLHFASVPPEVTAGLSAGHSYNVTDVSVSSSTVRAVSASGTTVTVASAFNKPINRNDAIVFKTETGWGNAYYNNRHIVCADGAGNGTFYAYNYGPTPSAAGIYLTTNGGAKWAKAFSGQFPGAFTSSRLECVPGASHSGEMFFTAGYNSGKHPNNQDFYECTYRAGSITCKPLFNVKDVWAFGFGKAKPDASGYPTIYILGAVNVGTSYKMGLWRSTDHALTWTQLPNPSSLDGVQVLIGDLNTYGRVFVCFSGSGCEYGQFN